MQLESPHIYSQKDYKYQVLVRVKNRESLYTIDQNVN
jgi:hypothetical protein